MKRQQECNSIFSLLIQRKNYLSITKQKETRCDCNSPLRWDLWMIKVHLRTLQVQNNCMGFKIFLHKKRTWVTVIEVNEGRKNKGARSNAITGNKKFSIHFLPAAWLIHSPSLSAESSPNPAASFQGDVWLTYTDTASSNIRYISSTDCITAQNILEPSCLHLSAASFLPTRGYVTRFSFDGIVRIFFRTLKFYF